MDQSPPQTHDGREHKQGGNVCCLKPLRYGSYWLSQQSWPVMTNTARQQLCDLGKLPTVSNPQVFSSEDEDVLVYSKHSENGNLLILIVIIHFINYLRCASHGLPFTYVISHPLTNLRREVLLTFLQMMKSSLKEVYQLNEGQSAYEQKNQIFLILEFLLFLPRLLLEKLRIHL